MANPGNKLLTFIGVETAPVSHQEKLISATGGFVAIVIVFAISQAFLDTAGSLLLVASMGASAVLLFAVPHGSLSQPWPVLGGHMISALVGVTAFKLVPHPVLAAGLAVGGAIGAMYYLRCLHPPGGATSLLCAIGDETIHALGYKFLITPLLLNVAAILLAALAFNYFFAWRRYPAALSRPATAVPEPEEMGETTLTHADIEYALQKLGSYVDVTEEELTRIYSLALKHAHESHLDPSEIRLGGTYSNGSYGENWSIRQVVDRVGVPDPDEDTLIYRVVGGKDRRKSGVCTRSEFARWAKYEVIRDESRWQLQMRHPLPHHAARDLESEIGEAASRSQLAETDL